MYLPYFFQQVEQLSGILKAFEQQRVCLVGTTCVGKSTLVEHLSGVRDFDALVFPLMNQEQQDYVCQKPWTRAVGLFMKTFAQEHVQILPGAPIAGTVVLESDRLIYLRATDYLLQQRTRERGVDYAQAVVLGQWIEEEVKNSGIRTIEFLVG